MTAEMLTASPIIFISVGVMFFLKLLKVILRTPSNSMTVKYITINCAFSNFQFTHSYLNASTGFLVAACQLCQLTVSKATVIAISPARANIHQLKPVR